MIQINGTVLPVSEIREERIRAEYPARTLNNSLRIVQVAPTKRRYLYTTAPLEPTARDSWLALDGQTVSVSDPTGTWQGYCRARIISWYYPNYAALEIEVEEL